MPASQSGSPYRWLMLSFPFLIAFLLHLLLFATAPMVTVIINVGPLVMPVVFGLLIDFTGTFQASIFSVAALAGVTFVLGTRATPAAKMR